MQETPSELPPGADPDVADTAASPELAALQARAATAEAQAGELRDALLRERADIENQRRRLARELEQARRFANERLLRDLLPVADNLERGLAVDHPGIEGVREGMQLTLRALVKVMADHGLTSVDPQQGEAFNPELHEAMSMVPAAPGQAPQSIVTVLEKGYVLNERLVRPARVIVTRDA